MAMEWRGETETGKVYEFGLPKRERSRRLMVVMTGRLPAFAADQEGLL